MDNNLILMSDNKKSYELEIENLQLQIKTYSGIMLIYVVCTLYTKHIHKNGPYANYVVNIKSHQVIKGFPHGSSHYQKIHGGYLKVYGPIMIFEIFSDLKLVLKMTSKFVFSQFA